MLVLLHIVAYVGLPGLLLRAEKRFPWIEKLGPVVLCYGLGIALGNIPGWQAIGSLGDHSIGEYIYQLTAVLAIPLVLFSADLRGWVSLAKPTLLSFGFMVIAACTSALVAYFAIGEQLPHGPELTGMSVGVYTGGTQNLTAIGVGLGVPAELIAKANLTDTLVSALYLLLVLSVLPGYLRRLLPSSSPETQFVDSKKGSESESLGVWDILKVLGLGILCLGLSFGVAQLLPFQEKGPWIISMVTLFGLLFSLYPPIRTLKGSFPTGEYLLLIFCVAIGAQIQLDFLTQDVIPLLLFFTIGAYLAIFIHFILVYLAKIDADTFLITSVAGIFNPIFIAPVARKLGNKEMIAPGMTAAIVGYAVGNFLGLGLAWALG